MLLRDRPLVLVLLSTLVWLGCVVDRGGAERTLDDYMTAVQGQDVEALFCLSAGAAEDEGLGADEVTRRAGFARWAGARFQHYLEGREAGRVDAADDGIVLVKLFALGRGTFYSKEAAVGLGEGRLLVRTPVRFGYDQVDLSSLSPGTTFYVGGLPLGTVHAIEVPAGAEEIEVEVLNTVVLDWTLVRAAAASGCPERWTVATVEPVPGSETTTDVVWIF